MTWKKLAWFSVLGFVVCAAPMMTIHYHKIAGEVTVADGPAPSPHVMAVADGPAPSPHVMAVADGPAPSPHVNVS
jgi:hypothetical protein